MCTRTRSVTSQLPKATTPRPSAWVRTCFKSSNPRPNRWPQPSAQWSKPPRRIQSRHQLIITTKNRKAILATTSLFQARLMLERRFTTISLPRPFNKMIPNSFYPQISRLLISSFTSSSIKTTPSRPRGPAPTTSCTAESFPSRTPWMARTKGTWNSSSIPRLISIMQT